MIRFILLYLIGLATLESVAQLPFAEAIQAPLALNPSMAGNKNKNRATLLYNQLSQKETQTSNAHLSFDTFLKKGGLGLGAYYLGQSHSTTKSPATWQNAFSYPGSKPDYFFQKRENTFGATVAPKYNIMDKVYFQEIKYSISPSLYLQYKEGTAIRHDNYQYSLHQICTCIDPAGTLYLDSASHTKSTLNEKLLTVGAGAMLTTDNLLFFARVQHETTWYNESFVQSGYGLSDGNLSSSSVDSKHTLYALQAVVGAGGTFPKKKETKLYLTPFMAAGLRTYLNLNTANRPETNGYNGMLFEKSTTEVPFYHGSFHLRYRSLIGGLAYSHSQPSSYYGLSLGFQNIWSRTMVTASILNEYRFWEIGTGVWF